MKKQAVFYMVTFFFTTSLLSQPCDVSVDSLKGQYKGECKNGKAEGEGTATGLDSYTGNFKNGYPEGQGKYTWKNGNLYEGFWKNGLFDGTGTLTRVDNTNPGGTSVITGFWKKGKYMGRYEKPYIVYSATNNINDINIRQLNKSTEPEITLTVKNITAGASNITNLNLPKSRLIAVQPVNGRFEEEISDETSSTISNRYIFRKITYPFHATLSFETQNAIRPVEKIDVEFFENSNWYVEINIDN